MFDIGDKVVCIRPFRKYHVHPETCELPQFGRIYTIADFDTHWLYDWLGIRLAEIDRWYWLATHFKKVVDFEEPKRKETKVLEPA